MKKQGNILKPLMLKQLILLLITMGFCISLLAQESVQKRWMFSPTVEFSGGTGIALYNKEAKKSYQLQQDLLYVTDLLVGIDFIEPRGTLSVQTGVTLDNHDFSFKHYYSFWEERNELSHSLFLNVPLSVGYSHFLKEDIALSFTGGLLFRKLVQYNSSSPYISSIDLKSKGNGLTYGVNVALGFHYYFSPNFSLHPQLYFTYCWGTQKAIDCPTYTMQDLIHISASPVIGLKLGIKYTVFKRK
ncbi:MAG: hypothetical protein J6X01_00820 [Bacteroidales bacterium]|jgi:hypothetical protein|nr:hypothetical protein [Bacteroidales bacterium]